jgi:general secretion pathway protein K
VRPRPAKGIALLVVLWVLAILTVTAFSFALMTRAETLGTLAFREGIREKYLAEAGIERGILEILRGTADRGRKAVPEGEEAWRTDGTPHSFALGGGECTVRIVDETGKIPLNALNDASGVVLKGLLLRRGLAPDRADAIVDAVLDWKDPDDLRRLSGAENEYYRSLPRPYPVRNANFETLEELLLVRGITLEILFGTGQADGIARYLTVHARAGRINLAVAPEEVLLSLPGMDPEMAERLLRFRSSGAILTPGVLQEILGAGYALMAPYVDAGSTGPAAVYTVEATGRRAGGERGYSIVTTVAFGGRQPWRFLYYRTPADLPS